MTSLKPFEKTLKNIRKTGKIAYGLKESLSSSDRSKLVICSSTVSSDNLNLIEEKCKQNSIPFITTEQNSIGLSKVLGLSYRISVFSILEADESDLNLILSKL